MQKERRVATKPPVSRTPARNRANYINNKSLLAEVLASKELDRMSDKLARMLQLLTLKYSKKGNYAGYTYNEDMQAFAMMMLVKTWSAFNPEKSSNPFAFYTQCIKNSFKQYLNDEKRQRNIRDILYVDSGLTPSYSYQLEHGAMSRTDQNDSRNYKRAHDEEDFEQMQADANDASLEDNQRFLRY